MSPVSRSRKPKKKHPRGKQRSGNPASAKSIPTPRQLLGPERTELVDSVPGR